MAIMQRAHRGEDHHFPEHLRRRDAHQPGELAVRAEGPLLAAEHGFFHLGAGASHCLASCRQGEPVGSAREELGAQIPLER